MSGKEWYWVSVNGGRSYISYLGVTPRDAALSAILNSQHGHDSVIRVVNDTTPLRTFEAPSLLQD